MSKFIKFFCLIALLFGSASHAMDSKSGKLGRELIGAVRDGKLLKVKMLLAFGAVDLRGDDGFTALFYAAAKGYEDMCRLLIEKKATVDLKDNDGRTPLMIASLNGYESVCRFLIEKNAAVDEKNNYGWTPLMYAARFGHQDLCRLLIKKNVTVDVKDNFGWTPLCHAAEHDDMGICQLLINAQLRRPKAAMITFLGIVRKRKKNLPCEIQYDVAKMIACMVFGAGAIQKEKQNIIAQIKKFASEYQKEVFLKYVKQQLKSHKK
jgi:ankyrin repeat protein